MGGRDRGPFRRDTRLHCSWAGRERILGPIPSKSELALMIIDEYIVFPPPAGQGKTQPEPLPA